ncbi:MAG: hypothetical protein Q7J48_01365 [Nocardioides sp.]|nr:hypothetical protein [Nocardioides sp.]
MTGQLLGLIPLIGTTLSNAVDIPLLPDPDPDPGPADELTALVPPVLSGLPAVGSMLSLSAVEWSLPGVTGALAGLPLVQLITNGLGVPLAGAPAATSVPIVTGSGKVGTLLTGTKGEATGTAVSLPVLGRLGDLLATTAPSIAGVAKAGNVLSVQPGTWGLGTLPTFGYQWYLDGRPISGATESQYVVKVTDAGRRVAVLVSATRLGFTQASAATAPVTVAKVASKTSLRLLKTYTVRRSDNGVRIVRLPLLKPRKHSLTAGTPAPRRSRPPAPSPSSSWSSADPSETERKMTLTRRKVCDGSAVERVVQTVGVGLVGSVTTGWVGVGAGGVPASSPRTDSRCLDT